MSRFAYSDYSSAFDACSHHSGKQLNICIDEYIRDLNSLDNSEIVDIDCKTYKGKACSFFTRPSIESEDGITRLNSYDDDAYSCFRKCMWKCNKGLWEPMGACENWTNWEKLQAEILEN